jgi:hypothetical protein
MLHGKGKIMNSTRKSVLVVNLLSLSFLGLAAAGCDGVEGDDPAGAPPPAAAEESFEVTSVAPGPDGKLVTTNVRMTESQWQQIVERRKAAAAGSKPRALGDSSVFETKQAYTLTDYCSDPKSSWFYSGPNFTGSRTCLYGFNNDIGTPDMVANVGYYIRSYITGNNGLTLICTGNYDCNYYQCGNGSSVWLNAGTCNNPYGYGCSGNVSAAPPPYYGSSYVHMQIAYPFYCH